MEEIGYIRSRVTRDLRHLHSATQAYSCRGNLGKLLRVYSYEGRRQGISSRGASGIFSDDILVLELLPVRSYGKWYGTVMQTGKKSTKQIPFDTNAGGGCT